MPSQFAISRSPMWWLAMPLLCGLTACASVAPEQIDPQGSQNAELFSQVATDHEKLGRTQAALVCWQAAGALTSGMSVHASRAVAETIANRSVDSTQGPALRARARLAISAGSMDAARALQRRARATHQAPAAELAIDARLRESSGDDRGALACEMLRELHGVTPTSDRRVRLLEGAGFARLARAANKTHEQSKLALGDTRLATRAHARNLDADAWSSQLGAVRIESAPAESLAPRESAASFFATPPRN